jgi:uncharacterized protein (DUF2141 family)
VKRAALLAPAALLVLGNGPSGGVTVTIDGLRNAKGYIRACITANQRAFPNCDRDPAAQKVSVGAANGAVLNFPNLPAGRYAISVLHDENGNGLMDKTLMLPKEGYGYSRNAPVRMVPPSFSSAAFDVGAGVIRTAIRIRYM